MIELVLTRKYFLEGTNGKLEIEGRFICFTIELPWKNNEKQISCIPEGKYQLEKRYSKKFKWHIQVHGVKNRNLILIHPANDAKKELLGCVAPISELTGEGKGKKSIIAFNKLKALIYPLLELGEKVYLNVQS